jgi:2-methylcitrate dehydratase PrpD
LPTCVLPLPVSSRRTGASSRDSEYARATAEWASALRFDDIPSEALRTARRAVLDTLAVTLLGSRSQAARIAAQTAFEIGAGDGPCSLIGLGRRTDALNAALINAHADLFDDNNAPMLAHPSSPLVSALLPLAQVKGVGGRSC